MSQQYCPYISPTSFIKLQSDVGLKLGKALIFPLPIRRKPHNWRLVKTFFFPWGDVSSCYIFTSGLSLTQMNSFSSGSFILSYMFFCHRASRSRKQVESSWPLYLGKKKHGLTSTLSDQQQWSGQAVLYACHTINLWPWTLVLPWK